MKNLGAEKMALAGFLLTLFLILILSGCNNLPVDGEIDKNGELPALVDPAPTTPDDGIDPTKIPSGAEISQCDQDAQIAYKKFIEEIHKFETINNYSEVAWATYSSIRDDFKSVLNTCPNHTLANIGYSSALLLAVNNDPEVIKAIDSLDAYFVSPSVGAEGVSAKRNSGSPISVSGATGVKFLVKSPLYIEKSLANPTWPTWLTLNFFQTIVDKTVIPALNNLIASMARLEQDATTELKLPVMDFDTSDVTGDSVEIDLSEIYMVDVIARLSRAGFLSFSSYNWEVTDASGGYGWIDDLQNVENTNGIDSTILELRGDTLFETSKQSFWPEELSIIFSVMKNTAQSSKFGTLRSKNHAQILLDLQTIPIKLENLMAVLRAEENDQTQDVIKKADLQNLESDLPQFVSDLQRDGFTPAFADNFTSPDKILDWVELALAGPITVSWTEKTIPKNITVNLKAYYDNPVSDLKTLWPKMRWLSESEWKTPDLKADSAVDIDTWFPNGTFYWFDDSCYYGDGFQSEIVFIGFTPEIVNSTSECQYGYSIPTTAKKYVRQREVFANLPVVLLDGAGRDLDWELILKNETFFPYFDDYTHNGLFPEMTREKWLDLLYL